MENFLNKIGNEQINGVSLLLIGSWIWWYSSGFPDLPEGYPGPELFPRLIAGCLFFAGILLIFTKRSSPMDAGLITPLSWMGLLRLFLAIGFVALYPLLRSYLGFIPGLSIICFAVAMLFGVRLWLGAVAAISAAFLIYGIFFYLLGVYL